MNKSPYLLYTPSVREPLPLRRKPYILPAPPAMSKKPQEIDWLRTMLPPFIMMVVLSIIASAMQAPGFIFYTVVMMIVYPIARAIAYAIQKNIYEKNEAKRAANYAEELEHAEREIVKHISDQRKLLKGEFPSTQNVCHLAEVHGENRNLWHRTNSALDFMALRIGFSDGKPSFTIEVPKGDDIESKDPLLADAKKIVNKYQAVPQIPFLLNLKEYGSLAVLGGERYRYGLAYRLLLDVLVHHRPDEVEVYVISNNKNAADIWGWLRWAPHCKAFDEDKEFEHLIFGNQAVKIFLGRLENQISNDLRAEHQVFVIDVDGIQQYDDDFVSMLILKATEWNISLLFVGGSQLPRSVRGILKVLDQQSCEFVDTRIDVKDKEGKEYHTEVTLDELPDIEDGERVSRALAGVRLLSSSSDAFLSPNLTLFDVLRKDKENKLTYNDVLDNWGDGSGGIKQFRDKELLQFPIGLVEDSSTLSPYFLNLLESRLGGKDAFHTMLIGTTGSGKSELIKSLVLSAAYKYPPQYLNIFLMDFKGGSTIDQLAELPHVIGVMTNLDEVLAQRGLIAINHEIERRQVEFKKAGKKDVWQFNEGRPVSERMPHLLLILDEFTRGLDLLNTPEFNLQDLLEKHLVPLGRSLGIYLLLANQVANAKALKLLPNIGWRIALRVASADQMVFIAKGLKSPKYAGRGYIQAINEDPVEFQSGFSGNYVKYTDLPIKSRTVNIKELLANGNIRALNNLPLDQDTENDFSAYLEMNQIVQSVLTAHSKLGIKEQKKIYLPPLLHNITVDEFEFERNRYRSLSKTGWTKDKNEKWFLKATIGYVDLVQKCAQIPLKMDFLKNNPHLLLVGSQTDVIDGLRTILFTLCLSHSPDDLNFYMLEFGKGLRDLPAYSHIGDIVSEQDTEKIVRTIEYFESEFARREALPIRGNSSGDKLLPHLFLVVNNIAGMKDNLNLYPRLFRFILQESHRYGIHIILLALPRGSGTRVTSSDLKTIRSRIVFPSINHDDYWHYLDNAERKLIKLTETEGPDNEHTSVSISRAHWLCTNDPLFDVPVELQLATPQFQGKVEDEWATLINNAKGYSRPAKIKVLEKKYVLSSFTEQNSIPKTKMVIGVKRLDLKELSIPFDVLPPIWGVSGPRGSGKTNFLITLLDQLASVKKVDSINVFSYFPNRLTDYCKQKEIDNKYGLEDIYEQLNALESDIALERNDHYILFDDINLFWDRATEMDNKIIALLENLSNKICRRNNFKIIVAFNYSPNLKAAKLRDGFLRELHSNKTGLCLANEVDWVLNSSQLNNYKNKLDGVPCPGRGVFIDKEQVTELQTFWFESE